MATLRAENVTKVFPPLVKGGMPVRALDNVNFEMSGQVFVSVVGPSGCGKEYFAQYHIGGRYPYIRNNEHNPKWSVTAGVGYVFQDARLLPWRTVIDNLLYVSDEDKESARNKALTYLEMVGFKRICRICILTNSPGGCSSASVSHGPSL